MSEVPLLIAKNGHHFQVCKEGILFLRTIKYQKLRIIFNVRNEFKTLYEFNKGILGQKKIAIQNKNLNEIIQNAQEIVTLHPYGKNLSHNRYIIIMNAYLSNANHPNLLFFAYLISSTIFYHNPNSLFSEDTHLTHLLHSFGQMLKHTNIDELNQKIKFKTGFRKSPYFLCLIYEEQSLNQQKKQNQFQCESYDKFKEFYRYKEGQVSMNTAVDSIIDYFPERSSLNILQKGNSNYNKQIINKIGNEFQCSILGRQLFNFEFTGCSMQSLCFEICQNINRNDKLNLVAMYDKIIINQKCRVQDQAIQMYITQVQTKIYNNIQQSSHSILPIEQSLLIKKHQAITQAVIKQAILDATNCMTLSQFQEIYDCLEIKMEQKLEQLIQINNQKGYQYSVQCYQTLQNLSLESDGRLSVQNISNIMDFITNKIQLYINECLQILQDGHHSIWKILLQLFQKYIQDLTNRLIKDIQYNEYVIKSQQIQIASLQCDFRQISNLNCKLRYDYELQTSVLNDYKLKISEQRVEKYVENQPLFFNYYKQNNILRNKIDQLKQQLEDKCIENDDLLEILQKNDGIFDKGMAKFKFSKELTEIIKDCRENISPLYQLIEKVKNTDLIYDNLLKRVNLSNEKKMREILQEKTKIEQKVSQNNRIKCQKQQLQEVIQEARKAIKVMKNVQNQFKESINALETRCGTLNCLLAETQADLQLYKKAITLLTEQILKGRSENLNKFFKVLHSQQLKQILRDVIKK